MNLKVLGMITSVVIIAIMIVMTIKSNFLVEVEDEFEDYTSGLIEDQVNEENGPNLDFGFDKGDVAADFELKKISGETVRLSDYRGKKVFLNFWASWCPPCKVEMPHMENYYKKNKESDNVEIIAVNMTSDERVFDNIEKFVESNKLTFPILLDSKGKVKDLYQVLGYPTTYLINEEGVIIDVFARPVDEEGIKKMIKDI